MRKLKMFFLFLMITSICYANEKSANVSVIAEAKSADKDGWTLFKYACIAKFETKKNKNEVLEKCSELLNSLKTNEFGIEAFNAKELDHYPKLRKGMSKAEVLEKFGKPSDVKDDGSTFYYENTKFCKIDINSDCRCTIYFGSFFDKTITGVTSWSDFKYEYTDNLKD